MKQTQTPKNYMKFKTWKTIKLGTGLKTADDFRKALEKTGFNIGDWASISLNNPTFIAATKSIKVNLIKVSVHELGFTKYTPIKDIYARAKLMGLDLCAVEVGPQLRLQYTDQPKGERLRIGMEFIKDATSSNFWFAFDVRHNDDGQWLDGYADPGIWALSDEFVFVRRRGNDRFSGVSHENLSRNSTELAGGSSITPRPKTVKQTWFCYVVSELIQKIRSLFHLIS